MSKLPPFLEDESLVPYTHLKSTKNLDFQPGQSTLTLSNIKVANSNPTPTPNLNPTSGNSHRPNPSFSSSPCPCPGPLQHQGQGHLRQRYTSPSYHPHQDKSAFVKGSEISVNDVSSVKEYSCMQVRGSWPVSWLDSSAADAKQYAR